MKNILALASALLLMASNPALAEQDIDKPRLAISTATFTSTGQVMRVHTIPTGFIDIRNCHYENCLSDDSLYFVRFARILVGKERNRPIPINTYLIEHPEGNFLIDAGGDKDWSDPGSWACDKIAGAISRRIATVDTRPSEEIQERLKELKIKPEEIKLTVITHLHFDHTAGIKKLKTATLVGNGDLQAPRTIGSAPCRSLDGVELTTFESLPKTTTGADEKRFGDSVSLTTDGSIKVFSTPGHTPGSLSIRVATDKGALWFIGDITFTDDGIMPFAAVAGIHTNIADIRKIHDNLTDLKNTQSILVVPSHDLSAAERIQAHSAK